MFVDGDKITGVIDWSGASQGDALFDLAILALGHKSISTTVDLYGHLVPEASGRARDALDKAFDAGSQTL